MIKFFDAIHGFIELDALETQIVHTMPFQRLKGIQQLATAQCVYGSGCHTRFDHSIGTLAVVSQIFDQVVQQNKFSEFFPEITKEKKMYWRSVLRIAALLHDVGHLPFSHTPEKKILGEKGGHEYWTVEIIKSHYIRPILEKFQIAVDDVIKVAVGKKVYQKPFSAWESIVTEMLTGDYFGADRIDYIMRDAYFTGLTYGSIDYQQLIKHITIVLDKETYLLGVEENGLESCYALLLARYFMYKRLYQHPKALEYAYHMQEAVVLYYSGKNYLESVDAYIRVNDHHIYSEIYNAVFDSKHPCHMHAKSILDQQDRIHVIAMTKKDFMHICQNLRQENTGMFFETNNNTHKNATLGFPVLRKNGTIAIAEDLLEIKIPLVNAQWAYVSPEHKGLVEKALGNATKYYKKTSF